MSGKGLIAALIAALLALLAALAPAMAQGVVFTNSDPLVVIHSTFTGRTITLFGNVESGQGAVPDYGYYDVIITLRGPTGNRIVRAKERQLGMILNSDAATYRVLPGYYAVLSSRPFGSFLSEDRAAEPQFSLLGMAAASRMEPDQEAFDAELVRLMQRAGLFLAAERGVTFHSRTAFSTRIPLPSIVPNGVYTAQAFVVARGEIVATTTTSFVVRTEGFERFVSRSAQAQPFFYGLAAVLIAIATGWIGGVLFKR